MEEKEVQCKFCGYTMKLDARKQDLPTMECPACGKLIINSEELASTENGHQVLSLNHNSGAARPKKDCPHCGGAVDPESVICVHCGYNWLIGKTHGEQHNMNAAFIKWGIVGAVIVAVCAVVIVVFTKSDMGGLETDEDMMTPAADVSQGDGSGMPLPEDGELATQQQEDGSEDSTEAIAIPDRPGFSDKDRDRLRAYRDSLLVQLDEKYPSYQKDETIRLRQGNGRIRRGEYLGIKSNILVLVEGSKTSEIPLELLDRDTRLHCDEAFRQQYIHSRLRQAAQRVQRENSRKTSEDEEF